jgi:GT2 family glycosyltransferase
MRPGVILQSNRLSIPTISVIVPTIGRPDSLTRLLQSLSMQSCPVHEVIVADGSDDDATAAQVNDPRWSSAGLNVRLVAVRPPHAVKQRTAAIAASTGELLLLLDDDVELEPRCVEHLVACLAQPGVVAATADFNNQSWPVPTSAWRFYLRHTHGMLNGAWQGRVVGPLLRFGFSPVPAEAQPMEWLATCNTLLRRTAYDAAGGFSEFFLHRSTINEDVDLGLKVARFGTIMFCPPARMAHYHAPGGRVSADVAAEDDLYNRFLILSRTQGAGFVRAFGLVLLYAGVETVSNLLGGLRRGSWPGLWARTRGRLRATVRIVGLAFAR